MSDGMPMATTGGVLVLATTGAQAGLGWMIAAAAALVVAGAVMLCADAVPRHAPGASHSRAPGRRWGTLPSTA
ncbi:hypothetical protein ACFC1U_20960 [Bacillus subtilis]|uniref:hypothetical protein n=1 Tax=Bacillus subtilis TaxID=1423 RepID=UPI0035DA0EE6